MARPPIPMSKGDRFGRLTVLADRVDREKTVRVACDCGSPPKTVSVVELRRRTNPLRSCGCLAREAWSNLRYGTSNPGERNGSAKLTKREVRAIRRRLAAGETERAAAKLYGISHAQVHRIRRGESWGHVR